MEEALNGLFHLSIASKAPSPGIVIQQQNARCEKARSQERVPLMAKTATALSVWFAATSTQWCIGDLRVFLLCRLSPIAVQRFFHMQSPEFFLVDFLKLIKQ